MRFIVAAKIVPDDQDVKATPDGKLDFSKAKPIISSYDTNAIEAAAQLAAAAGGVQVSVVSVGPKSVDDSKTKKSILARGTDDLTLVVGDEYADMDAHATAAALAEAIAGMGEWDVVFCGDGSADNYAQQVDVQLAAKLGVPSVNAVTGIELADGALVCRRTLEDEVQVVEVPLPAVIAVAPAVADPRIPGMKEILAAGKKPMNVSAAAAAAAAAIEVVDVSAPEQADRACNVLDAGADGAIEQVVAAIKAAM